MTFVCFDANVIFHGEEHRLPHIHAIKHGDILEACGFDGKGAGRVGPDRRIFVFVHSGKFYGGKCVTDEFL